MIRDKKVLFLVTIDTEIDKTPDWTVSSDGSFDSVVHGVPEILGPVFDRFDARPTYLLSGEVIENGDCRDALREASDCELGTHLHGDVIEPNRTVHRLAGSRIDEMECSYPKDVELGKLRNLTSSFRRSFGYSPRSFRAGRWGAGRNTVRCLEELHYSVDSSVSPGVVWDYPEGKADYSGADNQPYFPSSDDITVPGRSSVLEVPPSIRVPPLRRTLLRGLNITGNKVVMWGLNRLLPCSWVTPALYSTPRIIRTVNTILADNAGRDTVVLNMMFHSVDVIPGAGPAAVDKEESDALVRRIAAVLKYARHHSFEFITLSEARPYFDRVIEPTAVIDTSWGHARDDLLPLAAGRLESEHVRYKS